MSEVEVVPGSKRSPSILLAAWLLDPQSSNTCDKSVRTFQSNATKDHVDFWETGKVPSFTVQEPHSYASTSATSSPSGPAGIAL
eukprot:768366-Hanusia_phi.AAC.5